MRSAGSPRASPASSRTPSTCTAPSTQSTSRTRFRRRRGSGCSLSSPEPPLRRLWSPPRPPVLLPHYPDADDYLLDPCIDHVVPLLPLASPSCSRHVQASPDRRCGGGDRAVMVLLLPWAGQLICFRLRRRLP